jgi:hypothetical protein
MHAAGKTWGMGIMSPKDALSSPVNLIAFAGIEEPNWSSFTLGCVADIASVMTPWATWFCSGDATDGDDITQITDGIAYNSRNVIWLRTSKHPNFAIDSALHEAYHSAEKWLTADEIKVLRIASERGPVMARQDAYNDYWCRRSEVRARAFAAWGYAHWLMGTTPSYRWRMPAHERLWTMIYTGDLGLRVARKGYIHASRMPEVLRQRVADLGDGARMMDAGRKVVGATAKGLRAAIEWVVDAFRPDVTVNR